MRFGTKPNLEPMATKPFGDQPVFENSTRRFVILDGDESTVMYRSYIKDSRDRWNDGNAMEARVSIEALRGAIRYHNMRRVS